MDEIYPFSHAIKAIRASLHGFLQHFTSAEIRTAPAAPPLPEEDLQHDNQLHSFPNEMFAHLLIELPAHRSNMADAYEAEDMPRLNGCVHKLLGGACYCDAPELIKGLRELRLALKSEDVETIRFYYLRAIDVIDATLRYSGYQG